MKLRLSLIILLSVCLIAGLALGLINYPYPWIANPLTIAVGAHGGRYDEGIYLLDIRLREFTRLTPKDVMAFGPTWSPDGANLAYSYQIGYQESGISLIDMDTRIPRSIVSTLRTDQFVVDPLFTFLAWSPDSQFILFNAWEGSIESLYLVEVSTDKVVKLPLAPTHQSYLAYAWSPAGDLAIEKDDKIYLADVETGTMTFLVNGAGPFWKPDGQYLTYVCEQNEKPALCTFQLEDGIQEIIYQPESRYSLPGMGLYWSSDGRFIVFMQGGGESDPSYITFFDTETGFTHRVYENSWKDEIIIDNIALSPK